MGVGGELLKHFSIGAAQAQAGSRQGNGFKELVHQGNFHAGFLFVKGHRLPLLAVGAGFQDDQFFRRYLSVVFRNPGLSHQVAAKKQLLTSANSVGANGYGVYDSVLLVAQGILADVFLNTAENLLGLLLH